MGARVTCSCGFDRTYPSLARATANAARHVCKAEDGVRRATRRHRCARCGFEAVYDNAGAAEARYWFGKHSCRKREEAMLRATMAAQREALIDRTPKPCLHKVANHQHGTRACYVLDRCRCEPCSKAKSEAETWRERQKAYGRYQKYVPAGPVREHIQTLRDAGMGLKQIARAAGLGTGTLSKIVYGVYKDTGLGELNRKGQGELVRPPSRRVLRETAEKIYAIDPAWTGGRVPIAPGQPDPDGTPLARTHLRSLVALGWSMSELGRRLGMKHPGNIGPLLAGRAMQRRTVDAANALFEELCMTLPPETTHRERISATRSRRYAADHGWVPPLDLDDEGDLEEAPPCSELAYDEAVVQRALAGDREVSMTRPDRLEIVARARARGWSYLDIERITGIQKVERYIRAPAAVSA